jgi:hypothetical protein
MYSGKVALSKDISLNRSATGTKQNIRQLKLRLSDKPSATVYSASTVPIMRSIFARDMEWSTIAWYSGLCVTTVVAIYLADSWIPWVKIAGCITAVAGAAALDSFTSGVRIVVGRVVWLVVLNRKNCPRLAAL